MQWGDPDGDDTSKRRPVKNARWTLPAEFDRPSAADLPFTVLPDGDVYAPEVGFSQGFPAARDPKSGRAWLAHCYGMVGAGRDNDANSGGGTSLYVVTGHAPRNLDRNVTLLGRVLQGMEILSSLPRGPAPMGFYEKRRMRVPIKSMRVAADLPDVPTEIEVLRTARRRSTRSSRLAATGAREWYKSRPAASSCATSRSSSGRFRRASVGTPAVLPYRRGWLVCMMVLIRPRLETRVRLE